MPQTDDEQDDQISLSGHLSDTAADRLNFKGDSFFFRIPVRESGRFQLTFNGQRGYYDLEGTTIYLEPGMDISLISGKSGYQFEGKGGLENNLLHQLSFLIGDYLPFFKTKLLETVYSWEPELFIQKLETYRSRALSLLAGQPISPDFLYEQQDRVNYTLRHYVADFQVRYGIDPQARQSALNRLATAPQTEKENQKGLAHKMAEIWDDMHVKKLSRDDFQRLDLMAWKDFDINKGVLYHFSPEYRKMVDEALRRMPFKKQDKYLAKFKQPQRLYENAIDMVMEEISDPYIREALLYRNMKFLLQNRSKEAGQYYNDYERLAIDPAHLSEIKDIYTRLQQCAPGNMAPDFTYLDTGDNPVPLTDLKGHYVYIEIWATWCGPCQEQLPHFEALKKEYEGANIKFVGISVDKGKTRPKWKEYVRKNGLKGLQVISDDGLSSAFLRKFAIGQIPWGILIDPEGKIVSDNAGKPSDPALRVLFNKLLELSHG